MLAAAIQISNGNLLFGVLPESLAILLFGVCLIASTAGIRRVLKRQDEHENNTEEAIKR